MNKQNKNIALKNKLINLFEEKINLIFKNEPQYISNLRNQAILSIRISHNKDGRMEEY
jgi:DNA-binding XRE family transcriptional regulator